MVWPPWRSFFCLLTFTINKSTNIIHIRLLEKPKLSNKNSCSVLSLKNGNKCTKIGAWSFSFFFTSFYVFKLWDSITETEVQNSIFSKEKHIQKLNSWIFEYLTLELIIYWNCFNTILILFGSFALFNKNW